MVAKDTSGLRVDPAVLAGFAQSVFNAADSLQGRLDELNGQVGEMLNGWQGAAGEAYSVILERWHQGATEVESALSILAKLVRQAGVEFERAETAAAAVLRAVGNG